jgi:hypothetical protein
MNREFKRWIIDALTPPFRALGFVLGMAYKLLFGWYHERLARKRQAQLEQEVRENLSFLFTERDARVVANLGLGSLADLGASVVTIVVHNVLLRFVRWREEFQVHAAPVGDGIWEDLPLVLRCIEMPGFGNRSVYWMVDVARWLRSYMDCIEQAFSEGHYSELKQQLSKAHTYDDVVSRQQENEINRRLYG